MHRTKLLLSTIGLAICSNPALAGEISRDTFGSMPSGDKVEAITLTNQHGIRVRVITFGAAIQALEVPDAQGKLADIVLGHATLPEYLAKREFFGAVVGRVANRIANGRFQLDAKSYQIPANDGANVLHGGAEGFDRAIWQVAETRSGVDFAEVTLRHVSPDGDQGFPGNVTTTVRYRLGADDSLAIELGATADRSTVVGLSNHAYWNLAGEGSERGAMGMMLQIPADRYLPVDDGLIPTGEMRAVHGTAFDFREPHAIGERVRDGSDAQIRIGRGYDHNWIVSSAATGDLHLMARVSDRTSGRAMELWSDQPGLQFYSGNFLDATSLGKSGKLYRQGDAIVLEPQAFPDTVNQPAFGSVRLAKGKVYRNRMVYRFSATPRP